MDPLVQYQKVVTMTKRIRFSKKVLEAQRRRAVRYYVYDTQTPGLAMGITTTGARSLFFCRRVQGRYQRIRLGGFPDITLDQARKLIVKLNADIADGVDPQRERVAARRVETFGAAFEAYHANHVVVRCREGTQRESRRVFEKYLKPWHGRRLQDISHEEVKALHTRIGRKHGKYQANRVVEIVRAVYNYIRHPNPCVGIKRFREIQRTRFLQPDELRRFFAAIEAEPSDTWTDFFYTVLFTGSRRSLVESMRWSEISLPDRIWTVPADKKGNKADESVAIHLAEPVVEILKRRRQNGSDYVFPSHGKAGHIVEVKGAWDRIRNRAGFPDVRMHDLRRTFGSWQTMLGASLPIVGKSLGHRTQSSTAIYARLNLAPIRDSVDAATRAMLAAGNGEEITQ